MILKNKRILIISPEAWGQNHLSKHHYALELASRDNEVYFVNPPSNRNAATYINEKLTSINYKQRIRGINRLPKFTRDFLWNFDKRTVESLANNYNWDIVWSFDPYRFQTLDRFNAKIKIFHPVDVHHTKLDLILAQSADIVLGTSKLILAKYQGCNPNIHFVNHGLAAHFISANASKLEPNSTKFNVGYVGNLLYPYIDIDILKKVVLENPDCDFHFFGPSERSNLGKTVSNGDLINTLKSLDNCKLYGSIPSENLPGFINKMDLFFISYKGDQLKIENSNSHKILEYLSTGKVVISHYVDEYKDKPDLLEMVNNNSELPKIFKIVINKIDNYNNSERQKMRKSWATDNTYDKQINRIEQLINQALR